MPKPVKKAAKKKPAKPAADPVRRARQLMDEHQRKMSEGKFSAPADEETMPPHGELFKAQLSAYMSKLGTKGGKIGGRRRLETMTSEQRSAVAFKAAQTRWSKKRKRSDGA
jgi:hypothetical protein